MKLPKPEDMWPKEPFTWKDVFIDLFWMLLGVAAAAAFVICITLSL